MRRLLIVACVVIVVTPSVSRCAKRRRGPGPGGGSGFSAEAVDRAIDKAIAHLWSRQQGNGGWGPHGGKYPLGPSALVAYALLESGTSPTDPRMVKALGFLSSRETEKTYTLGLRANVYLAASDKVPEYRKNLTDDVVRLIKSTRDGSYNYDCRGDGKSSGDNSNSQYGLLGVWAGARARRLEIPTQYWRLVWKHWVGAQNGDGGWGYRRDGTRATMAAAGVASLFVCYDNLMLHDPGVIRCSPSAKLTDAQKRIQRGLDWFDNNFAASLRRPQHQYYYLYGVERVGLASGYKYFGKVDWYKMGATKLLASQGGDGAWGGKITDTAFALLFLIRGRNAVAFNKLQFTGDWNNRPRDLANLTRWLTRTIEGTVNWQIINTSVPVAEWHDSPILYISGAKAPKFTQDELNALRTFVHQGGTIFSVTECHGGGFTEKMYDVYGKLFGDYPVKTCPADHPLYNIHYKLKGRPRFRVVSNGVRPLAIHSSDDLALAWQHGDVATKTPMFQAAANVYIFVTDKLSSVRRRGTTPWPEKTAAQGRAVSMARVKYGGNYDPEPLACERFARLMAREHDINVKIAPTTPVGEMGKCKAKLAVMTGTKPVNLSVVEINALKAFINGGGTLFIDAAGGDRGSRSEKGFTSSIEAMLAKMYPNQRLRKLPVTDALYARGNMEIHTVRWRRGTMVRMAGVKTPAVRAISQGGRHVVLFSREDVTAALVGYSSAAVYGYHPGKEGRPSSGFDIMRNIILYANK